MREIDKETVIEQLKSFVRSRCLKKQEFALAPDESLINSGILRSVHLVELAVFIEQELGVFIPNNEFHVNDIDTLEKMADLIIKYKE